MIVYPRSYFMYINKLKAHQSSFPIDFCSQRASALKFTSKQCHSKWKMAIPSCKLLMLKWISVWKRSAWASKMCRMETLLFVSFALSIFWRSREKKKYILALIEVYNSFLTKWQNVICLQFAEAALNLFINSNAQELLKEMKPSLRGKLTTVMHTFIDRLFARIPLEQFLE